MLRTNSFDHWTVARPMSQSAGFPTEELPDHVFRWLEAVQRRLVREAEPLMSAEARELGMRRLRILQLIPATGIRQTDLAARALVSKQSLGPVIDALEAQGLIQRAVDTSDARAWIVTLSDDGQRVAASLDDALVTVERDLQREVGPSDAAAFLRVLRRYGGNEIEGEHDSPINQRA